MEFFLSRWTSRKEWCRRRHCGGVSQPLFCCGMEPETKRKRQFGNRHENARTAYYCHPTVDILNNYCKKIDKFFVNIGYFTKFADKKEKNI